MIPVEEARARILAAARPLASEWLFLDQAHGRALAAPLIAQFARPPLPMSAMDGYAARAADVANVPARLKVIGTAAAGHAFAGTIGTGEAVRIFTGAPVPQGADTVVIQENVEDLGGGTVIVRESGEPGRNIRQTGSDFSAGRTLIEAGRRIDAPAIALAASSGHAALPVRRAPRVAILTTGDELVRPGVPPGESQIVSSNSIGVAGLVRAAGGVPLDLGIAKDKADAIAEAIRAAQGAEVLVTLGGASVGDHDLVRPALEAEGVVIDFWKIAMRPGKPLMFGTHPNGMLVLGLPGNPVAALVCSLLFLRPLLLALQGLAPTLPLMTAALGAPVAANDRREDYLRARLHDGVAVPFSAQDSAMLHVLATADALIRRAPLAPAAEAGSIVPIIPLQGLW